MKKIASNDSENAMRHISLRSDLKRRITFSILGLNARSRPWWRLFFCPTHPLKYFQVAFVNTPSLKIGLALSSGDKASFNVGFRQNYASPSIQRKSQSAIPPDFTVGLNGAFSDLSFALPDHRIPRVYLSD